MPASRTLALGAVTISTAAAWPVAALGQNSFTVIGLPDTQNYSEFYPDIFLTQTEWIVDHVPSLDIRFVSHYGDVVNHGDDLGEWAEAEVALSVLDDAGLPWGVAAGNHDVTPAGESGSAYIPQEFYDRYGPDHWAGRPWFAGCSPSGMSSAQIFEAAGRQWLWLHLECDVAVRETAWAQGVLDQNRDKAAIVTTHRWLQDAEDYTGGVPIVASGRFPEIWYVFEGLYVPDGTHVEDTWRWFIRKNPSIFLVNCGHFHEEFRQTSTNVSGLPVHEVLADYQDDPNGGNGWLRIMQFDPAAGTVAFETYSPTLDEYRTADESLFSLPVDFDAYRLAAGTSFAAFQQEINGYEGTLDTWVNEDAPNTAYGEDETRHSDDDVNNALFSDDQGQALVRFTDVFSAQGGAGTIPYGSEIVEAYLTLELADDIDTPLFDPDFLVFEVIRDWDEESTWNSLDGGLTVGADLGELVAVFSGDNDPEDDAMRRLDVTDLVQRWSDGQPNYGVAILPQIIPGNDDGIEILTSESGNPLRRPRLEVVYVGGPTCPADVDGDGVVGVIDFLQLLAAWGPCPGCPEDLDGDGEVGVVDFLDLLAAWGPCPAQ